MAMSNKSKAILSALLSSSESSSDEEDLATILKTCRNQQMYGKKRRKLRNYQPIIHIPSKLEKIVQNCLFWKDFDDNDFRFHLRLCTSTFEQLLDQYIEYSAAKNPQVDKMLIEKQLICFLSFASKPITVKEIANSFDTTVPKIHFYITSVMEFLLHLAKTLVKLPESDEMKKEMTNDFMNITGLPNVIGCIDRTEIAVYPREVPYSQRLDTAPIVIQGICDSRRRFLHVAKDINDTKLVNYCAGGFCVLGGDSFQLREWLITKFDTNEELSECQILFNHKFNETHCLIGSAFALLKDRFQQLIKFSRLKQLQMTMAFIVSLCTLHNFAIDCNDFWDEVKPETSISDQQINGMKINFVCQKGLMKREKMMIESCMEAIGEEQIIVHEPCITAEEYDEVVDIDVVYEDYSDEYS